MIGKIYPSVKHGSKRLSVAVLRWDDYSELLVRDEEPTESIKIDVIKYDKYDDAKLEAEKLIEEAKNETSGTGIEL